MSIIPRNADITNMSNENTFVNELRNDEDRDDKEILQAERMLDQ